MEIAALGVYASKAEIDKFADIPAAAVKAGGSALGARPKFWASLHRGGSSVILGDSLPRRKTSQRAWSNSHRLGATRTSRILRRPACN